MKYRNGRGRIDGGRRKRRPGVAKAHKSIERFCLNVGLYPGAHIQRLAVCDVALKNSLVGNQNISAAIGQDAAHFGERKKRIQRNRDSTGADDRQEPMKTVPVVGAINGDRLAGAERD